MTRGNVEVTIQLENQRTIKIVGKLDELHYDANYPSLSLDLRDARFIEEKSDEI